MPAKRRKFSPQFKAEAVQMVVQTGRTVAEVARDLGINSTTLGNWVNTWKDEHPEAQPEETPVDRARISELEAEIARLRMENEFLKKGRGLLREGAGIAERCALIEAEKARYEITWMCRLLGVARSTFYYWKNRAETATAARRRVLAVEVKRIFAASRRTYGCRRVAAQLNREGIACSVGLVADLMREAGLEAVQPRAWKKTTIPGEIAESVPDRVERAFTAEAPGRVAVGDITYLRTGEGWLYLATVIDLHTRMVIGWQMADHMRTSLVTDALAAAKEAGHLDAGAVFHSDRGTQYSAAAFAAWCRANGVERSMGRTGVCWDNAAAESFFASLKNECYHQRSFATRTEARTAVADYIEVFYNRQRLHSTLGYKTPAETLAEYYARAA
ncbi:IS3 family transposase [Glycomyces sp. NEAU-7082]|uniref:IS3 family transposase n=2 Tax=Glycomyces albidus TaxID=2656774 RepID=A0A6L5GHB1_9ACTN|nr:IS3 family transposase [Glycomyces albidus]MQM29001.1 IS3 family transposase [Glycomyces albidus]